MTYGDLMIFRDDPKSLLRRLSAFVGPYPAKVLAQKGGCTEDTAEKWREGAAWPNARHWLHLVASFGRDLTDAVFHTDAAVERLSREVAELEEQLAERRAALRVVATEAGGAPPRAEKTQAEALSRDHV